MRDYPTEVAYSSRLWLAGDGRFRQEKAGDWDGMTLVHDGEKTWIYTEQSGVIEHETLTLAPSASELFDPAVLIPALDLEPRDEAASRAGGRRGGRPCAPKRLAAGRSRSGRL